MNTELVQPTGSTARVVNRQSIARTLGIAVKEVAHLKVGLQLVNLLVLFEKTTETVWRINTATGVVQAWELLGENLQVTTSDGTFVLYRALVPGSLNRIKTLWDFGALNTYLGYNPTVDVNVFRFGEIDNELLYPGSLHLAKDTYGIRRHACGLSVVINKGTSGLNAQLTGVSDSQQLSQYNSSDDAAGQFEAYSEAYKTSEDIGAVTEYGSNYFIADGLDFSAMRIGMVCRTKHATPYWAIITAFEPENKKVYVDKYARGNIVYTPANDGSGIFINYKAKIWGINVTSTLNPDSKAERMTTIEIGFQNQKIVNPADSNGGDIVSLGSQRGTAGLHIRNTVQGNNWRNGVRAAGCVEGAFIATNGTEGTISPYGYVNSTAQGYISYGGNVQFHSAVRSGGLTGTLLSGQNGSGLWLRNPTQITVANGNYSISLNAGSVLHNALTNDTFTLPASALNGEEIKIRNPLNKSSLTIVTSDGNTTITKPDGVVASSVTIYGNQNVSFIYTGSQWFMMGLQERPLFAAGSITLAAPLNIPAQSTVTTQTLAMSGVTLGMLVDVSCSVDRLGLQIQGYVSSAGVVTLAISNVSAAAISLPASQLRVRAYHASPYA